jgi:hypothetical protein
MKKFKYDVNGYKNECISTFKAVPAVHFNGIVVVLRENNRTTELRNEQLGLESVVAGLNHNPRVLFTNAFPAFSTKALF